MKYALLAYGNEEKFKQLTSEELCALGAKCTVYFDEMLASGKVVGGGSLDWSARTLRLRQGTLAVTDGPYIETKEVVGGLVIFEADSFDEAVQLASLHPAARMGEELGWAIELRPMDHWQLWTNEPAP